MRAAGINGLQIPGPAAGLKNWALRGSLSSFLAGFPDQCGWLLSLAQANRRKRSLQRLVQHLHYTGPLELLTMWLCFAGDPRVQRLHPAQLESRTAELQAAYEMYFSQHGLPPCAGVLTQLVFPNL